MALGYADTFATARQAAPTQAPTAAPASFATARVRLLYYLLQQDLRISLFSEYNNVHCLGRRKGVASFPNRVETRAGTLCSRCPRSAAAVSDLQHQSALHIHTDTEHDAEMLISPVSPKTAGAVLFPACFALNSTDAADRWITSEVELCSFYLLTSGAFSAAGGTSQSSGARLCCCRRSGRRRRRRCQERQRPQAGRQELAPALAGVQFFRFVCVCFHACCVSKLALHPTTYTQPSAVCGSRSVCRPCMRC